MRLLLDAHVSGPRVGKQLRAAGHDVRALDQEPELESLDDEEVLSLATSEQRILVTHNVSDFPRIQRAWASADRSHAGVILVYGLDHREFDVITRGIERWLELRPKQKDWLDYPAILDRGFASRWSPDRGRLDLGEWLPPSLPSVSLSHSLDSIFANSSRCRPIASCGSG